MNRLLAWTRPAFQPTNATTAPDDTFFVSLCLALFLSGLVLLTLAIR